MTIRSFEGEENLQPWFEKSQEYVKFKDQSFRKYLHSRYPKPNILMAIENTYLNIVHLITRNAIIATAVMLLCLSGFSAVAAENFAPEEYKPSQIAEKIFQNQQTDTNPYTPLKPDESNDVVSSDKCDLAIKYPKQIDANPVSVYRIDSSGISYTDGQDPIPAKSISTLESLEVQVQPKEFPTEPEYMRAYVQNPEQAQRLMEDFRAKYTSSVSINCFDLADFQSKDPNLKTGDQLMSLLPNLQPQVLADTDLNRFNYVDKEAQADMDKQTLKNLTGWFVAEADLQALVELTSPDERRSPLEGHQRIRFIFQDKVYEITFLLPTQDLNTSGVFANQVQMQFNSLVQNEPNQEIVGEGDSQTDSQTSTSGEFSQSSGESSQSASASQNDGLQTKVLTWRGETEDYILLQENKMTEKGNEFFGYYYTPIREEFKNLKPPTGAIPQFKVTGKIGPSSRSFPDKLVNDALEISEVQSVEQVGLNTKKGTIKGQLSYPSEYLHPQTVCAKSIITGEKICEYFTERNYSLSVPIGIYHVYSFKDKVEPEEKEFVYYDKFVTECMMKSLEEKSKNCNSNTLTETEMAALLEKIEVSVASEGEIVENINPQNWYRQSTINNNRPPAPKSESSQGSPRSYTNEYYPNLNLSYDSSWRIDMTTNPTELKNAEGENLLNRKIIFYKDGARLVYSFYFSSSFGGGGGTSVPGVKVSDNIYRYQNTKNSTSYIFSPNAQGPTFQVGQGWNLNSTIQLENGETAKARVLVEASISDVEKLKEVEEMLANSTFWSE